MTQSVKHGPPEQKLCFIGRWRDLVRKFFKRSCSPNETTLLLGWPIFYHLCHNEHAYAGQLNSLTHPRALLILHDRGIFWPRHLALLGRMGGLLLVCTYSFTLASDAS
jgi:hypothetical protein